MAELLGLVASVVQVAGAGVQLSKTLYEYVDGVATADRRIKDIASEIRMTSIVIEELGDVFKHEETASLVSKKAIKTANYTITECSALFAQIDATLKKSKKNTFGRLALPFRDTKLELLRSHVDKLKSTLHQGSWIKDRSAKKHEDLLRKDSARDNTLVDDDELGREIDQIAIPNPVTAASTINSTITAQSLATCVDHVRNLLRHIEILQEALAAKAPGDDHSGHHQNLVDSYFRTRGHLDQVVLGSSKHKLSPSTADSGEVRNKGHAVKQGEMENEKWTPKEIKEEELLARAKNLDGNLATKQELQATASLGHRIVEENADATEQQTGSKFCDGNPEIIGRDEHRQRRRDEQRRRQELLDREVAANLVREENRRVHFEASRAQAQAEQRADETTVKRADEGERLRQQEKEERGVRAAREATVREAAARKIKPPTNTSKLSAASRRNSVRTIPAEAAKQVQIIDLEARAMRDERARAEAIDREEQMQLRAARKSWQQEPMYYNNRGSRITMSGGHHPEFPPNGSRTRPELNESCVAKPYTTREYTPSWQGPDADTVVNELLKEWTTILG